MSLALSLSSLLVACFPAGNISVCTVQTLFDRNISFHTSLGLQSQDMEPSGRLQYPPPFPSPFHTPCTSTTSNCAASFDL